MARERMVATLRAEANRFIRERRNTRHIKKISLSETVFVIRFGAIEAIQAKVTGERGEPLESWPSSPLSYPTSHSSIILGNRRLPRLHPNFDTADGF